MSNSKWEWEQINAAKSLLVRASLHQAGLYDTLASEVIARSTPVVWFGDPVENNWVTIATNPSTREFLNKDGHLLLGDHARFYVRDEETTLEEYARDSKQLESTIELYRLYFDRDTAYRSWFGKKNGGKLEGLLNGMDGSFYKNDKYKRVVHTDFFPISTRNQMGKISLKNHLLDSEFARDFLRDTLDLLKPSLIIVLGKEHCGRFELVEEGFQFGAPIFIGGFPDARYQIGFNSRLNVPVVGLHFKPSEQFIGLGGGKDSNGRSHGDYALSGTLRLIGEEVVKNLKNQFPNYSF